MDRAVRKIALAAAVVGVLIGVSACAGATTDPTSGGGAGTKSLIVGVTVHQADEYFQTVANGVDSAVKSQGGTSILVNTQTDPANEATGFQNLISRKVSGIVTSPLSPTGSLASIKAAFSAKIPIVCYNTCLSDENNKKYVKAFIQSDQTDLGTQTGKFEIGRAHV